MGFYINKKEGKKMDRLILLFTLVIELIILIRLQLKHRSIVEYIDLRISQEPEGYTKDMCWMHKAMVIDHVSLNMSRKNYIYKSF